MQDDNRLIPFPTERHSRPRRLSLIAFLITEMIHQSPQFIIRQIRRNRLYPFNQFFNLSHLCNPFSVIATIFQLQYYYILETSKIQEIFRFFSRKSKLPSVHVTGISDGNAPDIQYVYYS